MKVIARWLVPIALAAAGPALPARAEDPAPVRRITILYDAFGAPSPLKRGWGFSALVEYGGRRVLFDTGATVADFEHNIRTLDVDLTRLDAVIISHRHGDHTAGLTHLLSVNPTVPIYTPIEAAFFKSGAPRGFFAPQPDLPPSLRYFDGKPPDKVASDTPWGDGTFIPVATTTEIFPGFFVFSTQSQKPGSMEMNEVALAIRTPQGLAVVVGCSHPGIEKILAAATAIDSRLYTAVGGFHLVLTGVPEVERVARVLHDDLKLARIAPAHCTSELGFAVFRTQFEDRFDEAGLGAVLPLP